MIVEGCAPRRAARRAIGSSRRLPTTDSRWASALCRGRAVAGRYASPSRVLRWPHRECVNAVADAPLLLVVEDAQSADEPSLGRLMFIGRRMREHRIGLVGGRRLPAVLYDARIRGCARPEGVAPPAAVPSPPA